MFLFFLQVLLLLVYFLCQRYLFLTLKNSYRKEETEKIWKNYSWETRFFPTKKINQFIHNFFLRKEVYYFKQNPILKHFENIKKRMKEKNFVFNKFLFFYLFQFFWLILVLWRKKWCSMFEPIRKRNYE